MTAHVPTAVPAHFYKEGVSAASSRFVESGSSESGRFVDDETAQQVWSDPRLQIYDCDMLALSGRLLLEEAERIGPL